MVTFLKETYGRQYTSAATGQSTATKVYCVITNSDYDELTDLVRDAVVAGLPDLGDAFGADSGDPKEIEKELRFFHIECRYESNQISFSIPTARIWDITFSSERFEYVPYRTLSDTRAIYPVGNIKGVDDDQPIWNKAGYSFDPPPTDFRTQVRISLTKNFVSIASIGTVTDIAELMGFTNSVNDDTVTIAGITGVASSFLIEDIQAQNTIADGFSYFAVTFTILYDEELHIKKVLNDGWMEVNPNDITKRRPITLNGGDISAPMPLDENGFKIEGANAAARANKVIYLGFGLTPTKDFSILNLPTAFNHS
jgi:hypothetical protein